MHNMVKPSDKNIEIFSRNKFYW